MAETKIHGLYTEYLEMLRKIAFWNVSSFDIEESYSEEYKFLYKIGTDNHLYRIGASISDIGFFGWTGEDAKREFDTYHKVVAAYSYLLSTLAEAVGFESMDNKIWGFSLKNINTDDMLDLYNKKHIK